MLLDHGRDVFEWTPLEWIPLGFLLDQADIALYSPPKVEQGVEVESTLWRIGRSDYLLHRNAANLV